VFQGRKDGLLLYLLPSLVPTLQINIEVVVKGDNRMAQTVQTEEDDEEDDEEDEAFLRHLVLPEEDRRRLYPTIPWTGGWRWFRSSNVVCLEQWRRRKAQGVPPSGTAA
jgi:hypothetical protein